jgi:hypothetical protein
VEYIRGSDAIKRNENVLVSMASHAAHLGRSLLAWTWAR